jgi:F0F1-type ATP synthase membrane subunit b/b'
MPTLDEQVLELKKRATDAEKARLMAEHAREVAKRDLETLQQQLQETYKVATKKEALELLAKLEAELSVKVEKVNELLREAEGSD